LSCAGPVLSPPAELSRFFTTFYLAEITVPEGERAVDYLHPEWGNLRFHSGDRLEAENYTGQRISAVDFAVTGPAGTPCGLRWAHAASGASG
jgi:hypothetical protein